jgi:DDE family transposase
MAAFDLALCAVRNGTDHLPRPEQINQLARTDGHIFRRTLLTPGSTLWLFVQQVANGNIACSSVSHLSGESFTDSAWCQARSRLPLEVVQQVHRQVIEQGRRQLNQSDDIGDAYRWRGHRLYGVDGSSDSMPDVPELRSHYGVPGVKPELGFPASHLLLMMDHRSGLLIDCQDAHCHISDASLAPVVYPHLQEGDILLGDQAFSSYGHLALLLQGKRHAVLPTHHARIVDFTPGRSCFKRHMTRGNKRVPATGDPHTRLVKTLGREDQLVEYFKPDVRPKWMSREHWVQLPESILVREIRRSVRRNGFRPITVTIVTTLLDPEQYPADELIELRLTRWMVETNIRHLKTTLGMEVLKCKSVEGIRKERLIFLLVYNLIRLMMLNAARRQRVNLNRLSFADALAWMRYGQIATQPTLKINPLRPGRLEPRVIRQRRSPFPRLTSPRSELKSQLRAKYEDRN